MSTSMCYRIIVTAIAAMTLTAGIPNLSAQQNRGPDRWERAISAFEKIDTQTPPIPGGIVFYGSSSIARWKTLAEDMAPFRAVNRGFGGSRMSDALRYLERVVLPHRPRAVVLYEGDNDIASGKTPEQIFADYRAVVHTVHAALPETHVFFIAVKPSIRRRDKMALNRRVNDLVIGYAAADGRLHFIDIWPVMLDEHGEPRPDLFVEDGLHTNAKGYAAWTRVVRRSLLKILPLPAVD